MVVVVVVAVVVVVVVVVAVVAVVVVVVVVVVLVLVVAELGVSDICHHEAEEKIFYELIGVGLWLWLVSRLLPCMPSQI